MILSGDRLLSLFLFVLALAYGWGAQQWPEPFGSHEAVGPETFPMILSVGLAISSLVMMFKPDANNSWPQGKTILELGFAIVVLFAYAFLLEPLGFIISTIMAVSFLSWRMGAAVKNALIISLACSVGVYLTFNNLLDLPLPGGLLEVERWTR